MKLAPMVPVTAHLVPLADGESGIFQTIRTMRAMVNDYKVDPDMRAAAVGVVFQYPAQDDYAEACALYEYVRDCIRYVKDIAGVETLATPDKTLAMQVGDCDDQTVLLATMLEAVGYPTRFVVAGYNEPGIFEHVYLEALVCDEWLAMDPTEQEVLGWSPPEPVAYWVEPV
jgi:transglutaminase-like putative cysteine protease